jgi:signal transduction histidine kinase
MRPRGRWWPNWRSVAVLGILLGSAVASAGGAWAVRDSWLEHQRAVEAALTEYAAYAARSFAELTTAESLLLRTRATAAVTGRPAVGRAPAPSLAEFAAAASGVLEPELAYSGDPWRGFFRIGPDGAYTASGAAADSTLARAVRAAVASRRERLEREGLPLLSVTDLRGESVIAAYALQRTPAGAPAAVYGYTGTRRRFTGQIARKVGGHTASLVPPSLIRPGHRYDDGSATSHPIALRVTDDRGREIYSSAEQFTSEASAEYVYRSLNTVHFRATLHPALVARVRAALFDDRRRPLQFALSALSMLLAGVLVLYVRRERELASARRDFVASVSHELRTPLAQIRMFSETLLLRREEDEEERMRWLGIIGREARRLGDLVENILLFSHIDAARMRLEPERTDLGELVEEAVEAYVPMADARRMRIVADAPSRIYAVVDPRALRQVVVNLLDNALKYGPAEQTVRVELERDGATARLMVADQGAGVADADRRRLFEPFVRLAASGGTSGGSGIGLSVVRSLVQAHGGEVWVDDAPGGGSRFWVVLPLAPTGAVTTTGTHAAVAPLSVPETAAGVKG